MWGNPLLMTLDLGSGQTSPTSIGYMRIYSNGKLPKDQACTVVTNGRGKTIPGNYCGIGSSSYNCPMYGSGGYATYGNQC